AGVRHAGLGVVPGRPRRRARDPPRADAAERARLPRAGGRQAPAGAAPQRPRRALVPALEHPQPVRLVRPLDRRSARVTEVLVVMGARQNFVKLAPLYHALLQSGRVSVRLLHTGQHYDRALSGTFLEQLGLPAPDHYLGVGSGTHAEQTAAVMV